MTSEQLQTLASRALAYRDSLRLAGAPRNLPLEIGAVGLRELCHARRWKRARECASALLRAVPELQANPQS